MGLSGVCGNLFDSQLTPFPTPRPTPHPTTSTPTPSPTWISSFDTWTGGPVTFSVWTQEVNAGFPGNPKEHDCEPAPFGGTSESCLPDIWCRILLPDGEQVRTDMVSNDDTPKWDQSEALTVTLDQNDYIDVKCWTLTAMAIKKAWVGSTFLPQISFLVACRLRSILCVLPTTTTRTGVTHITTTKYQ